MAAKHDAWLCSAPFEVPVVPPVKRMKNGSFPPVSVLHGRHLGGAAGEQLLVGRVRARGELDPVRDVVAALQLDHVGGEAWL